MSLMENYSASTNKKTSRPALHIGANFDLMFFSKSFFKPWEISALLINAMWFSNLSFNLLNFWGGSFLENYWSEICQTSLGFGQFITAYYACFTNLKWHSITLPSAFRSFSKSWDWYEIQNFQTIADYLWLW